MGPNQPGQPAGLEGSISRLEYLHSRDAPWVTLEELLCALARLEDSSLGQGIQASTPELLGAERIKADSVMEGCHGSHTPSNVNLQKTPWRHPRYHRLYSESQPTHTVFLPLLQQRWASDTFLHEAALM